MTTKLTKEEYQNFISAWKSATNAPEAKAKRVVCDHEQYCWDGFSDEEKARLEDKGYKVRNYSYTVPNGGHCKEPGWLNSSHFVLYNIMRGKDPSTGFYPKMKKKLQYGETPWVAFERAAWNLEFIIGQARNVVERLGQGKIGMSKERVDAFLRPFGGKITMADLLKIDKEELASARKFPSRSVSEVKEVA